MHQTDHSSAPSLGGLLFTPGVATGATGSRLTIGGTIKSAALTVALSATALISAMIGPSETTTNDLDTPSRVVVVQPTLTLTPMESATTQVSVPYREHAARISTDLGLGKSDIARIFDISRPTLYSWIKGETEPKEGRQADRVRQLGKIVADSTRPNQLPIYDRFVEYALPGEQASILDLLRQPEWDVPQLRRLIVDARRLSDERNRRIAVQTPGAGSSRGDGTQIDNLIDLGNA